MKKSLYLLALISFTVIIYSCSGTSETKDKAADASQLKVAAPAPAAEDSSCVKVFTFEVFDLAQLQTLMKEKDLTGIKVTHKKVDDREAVVITAQYKTTPEKPLVLEAIKRCPLVCD
jgi:hypothetical protein